jgi:type IV pilus assembly protein PilY1
MKNCYYKFVGSRVMLAAVSISFAVSLLVPLGSAHASPAPGCSASVSYSSEDLVDPGLKQADYYALNVGFDTSATKYQGSFSLDLGQQAINPDGIVIPFEQDVCVSFFYEDAGYTSSLGWIRADEAVFDGAGAFDWDNTPDSAKHPVFEQVADGSGGGDGILDAYVGDTKSELAAKGFSPFGEVNSDDVTAKDMRKCLGTFGAGAELVFWLANQDGDWRDSDIRDPSNTDIFFTKKIWNPDTFTSCLSSSSSHDRTYLLGQANAGESCDTPSKGFLDTGALARLSDPDLFNLTMSGSYNMTVDYDEQFSHVIVAAPDGDPNQWILSWEDLNGGGDMDYNDITFRIDRKNGGTLVSKPKSSTSIDVDAFYTAVTFGVYDEIPACTGNRIDYFVSVDNGLNWVEVTNWDRINAYTLEADGTKTLGAAVSGWSYGSPANTYREARIDFIGLNLSGQELVWKAEMRSDISDDSTCIPRILGANLDGSTATPADISRSSPIMVGNVLFSGSLRTPEVSWSEKRPRGYLRATEMYAPSDPSVANDPPVTVWEGGSVLDGTSSAARDIYFPDVAATSVVTDPLTLIKPDSSTAVSGDAVTTLYTGTLTSAPVLATSVRIFAGTMEFRDEGAGRLVSNWGRGVINLFTGEFVLEFDSAPLASDLFSVEYAYYGAHASQTMQPLEYANARVSDTMLGLDDRLVNGTDPVYDFNDDGVFSNADRQIIVDWTRGGGRDWKLGAIDHSVPAVVVPPSTSVWYYGTSTSAETRSSFDSYVAGYGDRDAVLFVGSRDGMLHAFDAGPFRWGDNPATASIEEQRGYFAWIDHDNDSDTSDVPNYGTGQELWSFVPANLLPRLKNNYINRVSEEGDQAFVDASPTLADIRMDVDCPGCVSTDCVSGTLLGSPGSEQCLGEWRTVLLAAQGNGGDSVVALDVTDPADPQFMWEYSDPELFRSRSSPAVGKIGRILVDGVEKWVAFFVSGKTYDTTLYPSIYLIDVTNGSLVDRIHLDAVATGAGAPSGLGGVPSGQPAIIDSDGNGYIDRLYIGTDKGLMYKVDFSDDPALFWSETRNVVINWDYYDDDTGVTINGQPNPVPDDQMWHPIYASPTVMVENGVNPDGSTAYNVRVFFGTGDNPYFDEDIDTGSTNYHFFSYLDKAPKGSVDHTLVELDWFYPLDPGQRIFASAFSAAGKIYFGTSTSDTEDPCDGDNLGELYSFDTNGSNVDSPIRIATGDIVTTPLVEDEHLFVRSSSGTVMMGGGGFNNKTKVGGLGVTKPSSWREITD